MPERGGWGMPPRRRPPWWPENETWPPIDRDGRPVEMGRRHGWWPAVGCFVGGTLILALLGAASLVAQILGILFGPFGGPSRPFAALAVVVLVLAVVALARGFRRLAAPLTNLVEAARRVEAGSYDVRVPELRRGPRELRELTRAFNTMVSRLETSQQQRRSLLADVSHELRTPLAVLRGNLEAIADGVHPPDEAHLLALIDETQVMERLVEDLRTISLADAGALTMHREPTDPDVLLADVAAGFRAEATRAGVTLDLDAPHDLPILVIDPLRVREVLANLVTNALRHTPTGGRITLTGRRTADHAGVIFTVADTGTGIEPDVLPLVFDRFAKGPTSRGSGLGLAIARDLVVAHGGTIAVESEPGRGTTMTVQLPIERETAG